METQYWQEIRDSKDLKAEEIDTVIYHSPCPDGMGAAYGVWKYFQLNHPDKEVNFIPANIGSLPPDGLEGKNVLITDYSYRKDTLLKLIEKTNKLLVIDHHKTAEKDLVDIDNKYKIFDMKHSGAMLTWFFLFDTEPCIMLRYIEDRDIWKNELPNINEFAVWWDTIPMEFEQYDKYSNNELFLEMIATKGKIFLELNNHYIKKAVEHSKPKFCTLKNKHYFVAYVDSSVCKSDVGNRIFEKYPLIDFSAVYSINGDTTLFSLRSTNKHVDVSEVAFSLSGGGHRNASGVKVEYATHKLPSKIHGGRNIYKMLNNVYFRTHLIESGDEVTLAYLPSPICRFPLLEYLMQVKYIDSGNSVTNAENLYESRYQQSKRIDGAIVWNIDLTENNSTLYIKLSENLSEETRLSLLSNYSIDNLMKKVNKVVVEDIITHKDNLFKNTNIK